MKKTTLAGLLMLTTWMGSAQSTNVAKVFQSNFAKAEVLYRELAFRNALELYLAAARKDSLNPVVQQRIADCYVRLGKLAEAEHWYSSLVTSSREPSPEHIYQYAQVLTSRSKYHEAEKWFGEYASLTSDRRAGSKIDFLNHIDYYLRDSLLYEVRNEPYNSDQSDFAPQYFNDGIVFVSARDRDMFIKHQSTSALNDKETMLNIYFAPTAAATENDAVSFGSSDMKSVFHDGPIVFFDNNRKAAFSRSNLRGGKPVTNAGKVNLGLHFGELDAANSLTKVQAFKFNDDAFSIAHPWMSEDGNKLFFTSNQPGGQGGADLYVTERSNSEWSTPMNLGATINTLGDEFYPFLANDSTLYFASNGHGSLGGLDNYMSIKRNGQWSKPVNLGFPLNSAADDFSLIIGKDGRRGMFSSDRPNGLGYDDVYSFAAKSFSIIGRTVDKLDPSKFVASAKVSAREASGKWLMTAVSDEQGYFSMDLPFDASLLFVGEKEGYTSLDTLHFSTSTRTMGRDSIKVKLWEHTLLAKGTIFSNETQDKLVGATIVIKNLTDGQTDSVRTTDGSYSFNLEPDKKYIIGAHSDGYIPREFEMNTHGIMTGSLVNDMVLEEEFKEKIVIQFDFEKWDIKPEGHASLDKVVRSMLRNKKFHLHVGAYADARGTHEFNLNLSNRRAAAVVQFMETRGVPAARITAIGFGEELVLNRCSNGVICTDEEHSKNRRAELKIQ